MQPSAFEVERCIRLPPAVEAEQACARLQAIPGVVRVTSAQRGVRVRYDNGRRVYRELVAELEWAGLHTDGGWLQHLCNAWFSYLDENARANAAPGDRACCSRPTDVYASRKRRG